MVNSERWQPISGWEGFYSASDSGRIRSEDRVISGKDGRDQRLTGRLLKQYLRADGRSSVLLANGDRRQTRLVYHLVLEAFVSQRPIGMEARHLNDIPSDNRLSNLAWGTSSENKQDVIRNTGRTSCHRGHEYTDETTHWYRNTRYCRICRSAPRTVLCSIDDCATPATARGMCRKHYTRWHRYGDPHHLPPATGRRTCSIEGCEKFSRSRGLCEMHYGRLWRQELNKHPD